MTQLECELKLLDLMEQAYAAYKEFNPGGRHLSMSSVDGFISIQDAVYDDAGTYVSGAHTVNVTKYTDGMVMFDGSRSGVSA